MAALSSKYKQQRIYKNEANNNDKNDVDHNWIKYSTVQEQESKTETQNRFLKK